MICLLSAAGLAVTKCRLALEWILTFTCDNLDLAIPQNELQLSVHG